MHPLMVLAHPTIVARWPEPYATDFHERAAIREHLGLTCYYDAERKAAREVARQLLRDRWAVLGTVDERGRLTPPP